MVASKALGVSSRREIQGMPDVFDDMRDLLKADTALERVEYRVFDKARNVYVDIGPYAASLTPTQKAAIALKVTEGNPGYAVFREIK